MAIFRDTPFGRRAGACMDEARAWYDAASEWVAAHVGRPASWVRREPLACRPLIVIAGTVACGIAISRLAAVPGSALAAVMAWWCGAAMALAAWAIWLRRRRSRAACIALLVSLACTAAGWSAARWSLFAADDLAWSLSDAPTPVAVEGVVVESPRLLHDATHSPRSAGPDEPPSSECTVAIRRVRHGAMWRVASGRACVITGGDPPPIRIGDRVRILGRGLRPMPALNPDDLDHRAQARAERCLSIVRVPDATCVRVIGTTAFPAVGAGIDRLRERAAAVLQSCIARERAGLATALLLGGRESLPREDARQFLVTGTIHIMSISGLHVGILAYAVCRLLRLAPIRRHWMLMAALALTGGYMLLVGAQTPVVRATVVVWLACLGSFLGRRSQGMTALAAAAIVVLIWQPAALFHTGAQLSFVSTAVLVAAADFLTSARQGDDPIARLIDRSRPPLERWLRRTAAETLQLFAIGAAVWIVTAPVVAARFHVISPVALLLNPLIAPLVAMAMGWGFLCLAAALVSQTLAIACGWACDATLGCMATLVQWAAALPGAYAWVAGPPSWWVAGWYFLLAGMLLVLSRERLRQPTTWALVAGLWIVVGVSGAGVTAAVASRPAALRAVVAALGHGCGIVVRSPAGRYLVYDAGRLGAPGAARRAMAGVLWDEGVHRIDTLVISHADADHFNAVADLIERFAIGEIVVSEDFLRRDSAAVGELLLLARQSRIPVRTVAAGDSLSLDPLCRVRVLHPHRGAARPKDGPGSRLSDNETSIVMAVEAAGRRLLFTGDLEGEALRRFIATDPDTCDVLVAPHHGSATSLPPDIARATSPDWVVVSGVGGRRWPEVMHAYASARADGRHSAVLKTGGAADAGPGIGGGRGAIAVTCTAERVDVAQYGDGHWRPVDHEGMATVAVRPASLVATAMPRRPGGRSLP